jgi:peptidyl-prolyl cis-trans isomerase-like protein 2
LKKLEAIPVDEKDRPERDIRMKQVQVFVDPFEEYQTRLKKKLAHEANAEAEDEEARIKREKEDKMGWFGPNVSKKNGNNLEASSIGKYMSAEESKINKKRENEDVEDIATEIGVSQKKQKVLSQQGTEAEKKKSYGNFDNF